MPFQPWSLLILFDISFCLLQVTSIKILNCSIFAFMPVFKFQFVPAPFINQQQTKFLPLRILAPPACRYEGTGSRFVGSQFIFRFDFQDKIFNNSYFMLTHLSAYLRVSWLLMITRLGIWRMNFMTRNPKRENFSLRTLSLKYVQIEHLYQ